MEQQVDPVIVGLPPDFELSPERAHALAVDSLLAGVSLKHGLFESATRLGKASQAAEEAGDSETALALHLLMLVSQFSLSEEKRSPFGRYLAGHFEDGRPWYTALPENLTDAHVVALESLLTAIHMPAMRARISDVLWHRARPRNVEHARVAVKAYLEVAEAQFDPNHWVDSEDQFARAFRIALQLGRNSPELGAVTSLAWTFLSRLKDNDPLYYTERIATRISPLLKQDQALELLERAKTIALQSLQHADWDRARTYYDLAIRLAQFCDRDAEATQLRLDRAETHATQANAASNETHRSLFLRIARQQLVDAGASRERIDAITHELDLAQRLSIHEMTAVGSEWNVGLLPDQVRAYLQGVDPIEGIWRFAGLPVIAKEADVRRIAEQTLSKSVFAFGFARRHLSRDGRQQGISPGSLDARNREDALRGVMRFHAAQSRMGAVVGAIEPGRHQLAIQCEYSLADVYEALRSRPFIPEGHLLLFAKGIHAGLVGEYDVALHLLAPQIENALREILRRHGELIYSTHDGVQSLISAERVLDHPKAMEIFGADYIFTLQTVLTERLGANVRNDVAHGIVGDYAGSGFEAIFTWWLALRLLRFYGPDPLAAPAATDF